MRPAGEVRLALYQAAQAGALEFAQMGMPNRGLTLAEMADRSCVGRDAAMVCVKNMRRSGVLRIVAPRRVDYRNRPVAEYVPADLTEPTINEGWVDLGQCMADWVR